MAGAAVKKAVAVERKAPEMPRIVKKVPRDTDMKREARERALAGTYRVIHSSIIVPRPLPEWQNEDGTQKSGEPSTETAIPGDEVYLGNEDALLCLNNDLVEPLDAKPSRVGKVLKVPPTIKNSYSPIGAPRRARGQATA